MFKPYTTTLTTEEHSKVDRALKTAMYFAKKYGNEADMEIVESAASMMLNHERIGGWETEAERRISYIDSMHDHFERFGTE